MKLPLQQGTSRNGNNWMKQEYVLETNEAYPKKVHFDFFGERANQYNFEVGDVILLSFDIESREYNGRWYTDIRGWKAEKVDPNLALLSLALLSLLSLLPPHLHPLPLLLRRWLRFPLQRMS